MECCSPSEKTLLPGSRIALIGNPNVGKSMLFHRLTGKYVTVSNYPGTTVEISQGALRGVDDVVIVDTPGIVTFPPRSDDEAVTARVLLREENLRAVVQVGDAKNLRRTLHLAVQLAEMGLPMVLALNMIDEARARGLSIESESISAALGVPVVSTVATRGQGVDALINSVSRAQRSSLRLDYPEDVEAAVAQVEPLLPSAPISARSLALLWLGHDAASEAWLEEHAQPANLQALRDLRAAAGSSAENIPARIQQARGALVEKLAGIAMTEQRPGQLSLAVRLGRLSTHPFWGLPILALSLYAMYWFVGVFGAGTLVGLLEENLFGEIINPWLTAQVEHLLPWPFLSQLLVGQYGLWTMGMTYAIALLLPIVITFFITFGILEDSGYLPRLAVLTNRIFTSMGLNGQAVLPMVLGLGCVTMATMTTRILTSRRDRILVTFLLALAVPCSAQLGVVMGLLAGISLTATLIWLGITLLILFAVGWLSAKLMPGERAPLVVELPPLRLPVASNVLIKTMARLEWYIKEAVPLFLAGTLLLFFLDWFHILPGLIKALEPIVVGWLGLPKEAASAFLLGLLRRDFAATGLFALQSDGLLTAQQMVVAIVVITLFVPCIASMFMIIKERGSKIALSMILFIFPFAVLVGGVLHRLLNLVGWGG